MLQEVPQSFVEVPEVLFGNSTQDTLHAPSYETWLSRQLYDYSYILTSSVSVELMMREEKKRSEERRAHRREETRDVLV